MSHLQADNGAEFCNNKAFDTYLYLCIWKKIILVRRLMNPNSPQKVGITERENQTLNRTRRCLFLDRS